MQIQHAKVPYGLLAALAWLGRPATKVDLPGEITKDSLNREFGVELVGCLESEGLISSGRTPDDVPERVMTVFMEWLEVEAVQRAVAVRHGDGEIREPDHSRFYAITSDGWRVLCSAIDAGQVSFMRPPWAR